MVEVPLKKHSEDAVNVGTIPPDVPLSWCCTGLPVNIHGEFDPGSGRTLAACLTHASRTMNLLREGISGERVSNTWAICPALWDKPWKRGLIPDMSLGGISRVVKLRRCRMSPRPISLLVR